MGKTLKRKNQGTLEDEQVKRFRSQFRRKKITPTPFSSLFYGDQVSTGVHEVLESTLYRSMVHLSDRVHFSLRSFVFGAIVSFHMMSFYQGFNIKTSYLFPGDHRIFWATVRVKEGLGSRLDMHIFQTHPDHPVSKSISTRMVNSLNDRLAEDGFENLRLTVNGYRFVPRQQVDVIEITRPKSGTYDFVNTVFETEKVSASDMSPLNVFTFRHELVYDDRNRGSSNSRKRFYRIRLGRVQSQENDLDIGTELMDVNSFKARQNPVSGRKEIALIDRMYAIMVQNQQKLNLDVHWDTMFRLMQGFSTDFFFFTEICTGTSMRLNEPGQVHGLAFLHRTRNDPFYREQATLIAVNFDGTLPLIPAEINTQAEQHQEAQMVVSADEPQDHIVYPVEERTTRLTLDLKTAIFRSTPGNNEVLPRLVHALRKTEYIYGDNSARHTVLGMALTDYNEFIDHESLHYVDYKDPELKRQLMTLVFKRDETAHLVHVADSDTGELSVRVDEVRIDMREFEKVGIRSIEGIHGIEAKAQQGISI